MRICFAGTPHFAIPSLQALHEDPAIQVLQVYTQPPRPRGRGQRIQPTPVANTAKDLGLEVVTVENINAPEHVNTLKALDLDFLVVVAFGQKLSSDLLTLSRGAVNLHASLLPRYRGANPIQWAILNGDPTTGVTTMLMDEGWDTGPVLLQKSTFIDPSETGGELHDRLARLGAPVLVDTLQGLMEGTVEPKPQGEGGSFAPKLKKEDYTIHWGEDVRIIERQIRAFNPWPVARTKLEGEELRIWSARSQVLEQQRGQTGEIISTQPLLIQGGQGLIEILEIQRPGKKRLPSQEFIKGFSLRLGMRLGTDFHA